MQKKGPPTICPNDDDRHCQVTSRSMVAIPKRSGQSVGSVDMSIDVLLVDGTVRRRVIYHCLQMICFCYDYTKQMPIMLIQMYITLKSFIIKD